jgi:hypothetical protein
MKTVLGSAVRAISEGGEEGLVAIWAFSLRNIFNRNDPEDFTECGHPGAKFFHGIFLHQPHPICSGSFSNLFGIPASSNQGADGFAQMKKFVYADAALITALVAFFAPNGHGHG